MAKWDNLGSRGNVEDRRGMSPTMVGGLGGISFTGLALLLLINYMAGGDLGDVVTQLDSIQVQEVQNVDTGEFAGEDSYEIFASTVLGSNNDMWREIFNKEGRTYNEPRLVLFRQATQSGCGYASSALGPHYCPIDNTIYLDETFFDELQRRFGAQGGDVAEAYVIAHEVAHHAQNELGIMNAMRQRQARNPETKNAESIKLELQADCFAGLWGNFIKDENVLGPNEIEEAMDAAAAVGDDRIQEAATGHIDPEAWTHGSSKDRVEAFTRGYQTGSLKSCDTFN